MLSRPRGWAFFVAGSELQREQRFRNRRGQMKSGAERTHSKPRGPFETVGTLNDGWYSVVLCTLTLALPLGDSNDP